MDGENDDNRISKDADGSTKLTTKAGQKIKLAPDGSIGLDLPNVKGVTIEQITDLTSHRIMREGTLTVHEIEFLDGGTARLAYTSEGKLVEFSANKMGMLLTPQNQLTLKMYSRAD